jgi:hypothetical protein
LSDSEERQAAMDHDYIEEYQVAERYVMGTLPEEEVERFEDHYFSCPECQERIEIARSMRRGFQRVAREDATVLTSARQLAFVAWLTRLGRSRQIGALFLAFAVVALLPAGLSWQALSESGRAREDARAAERLLSSERARSAQETARLRSDLQKSNRDLDQAREARAEADERLARALQNSAKAPLLYLEMERDADPGSPPTQQLRQPEVPVELAVDPSFASYRVVLKNAQGHEIWSRAGLRLTEDETLRFRLLASVVPPGDYTFVAEGSASGGKPATAGRFPFRVVPAD